MTTPPCVGSEFRLVMYESEFGVVGSLYSRSANPYSEPLFSFPLRPDQELPRLKPGGLVHAHGTVAAGCTPMLDAVGVEIVPAEPLAPGTPPGVDSRLFAERGGVVCHPEVAGWAASWRFAQSPSVGAVAAWERRLKRDVTGAWLFVGFMALTVVFVVVAVVAAGQPRPIASLFALGASLVATVVSWRLARRSQRALSEARMLSQVPARQMRMRLWWSAGYGQGPMAVASLYPAAGPEEPESHVSVVNVPAGFAPEGLVPAEVVGDPRRAPIIRCGDAELWPAEFARQVLGARDGSRGRTARDGWISSILGRRRGE